MPLESPRIPLPPGQSGPSLELDELELEEELELLLDELLELDEELLEELLPEEELEPELLLDDELEELLELDEELLEELESDSSPSGTPPLVNMITALKYPRYPGSEKCIIPTLPSP